MHTNKGFTLMEMLVVIAIMGILVGLAYPSYQETIIESRRADAKAALMGFAQAMERHYTTEGSYLGAATGGANTGAPTIFSTSAPLDSSDLFYQLKIHSAAASSYVLAAEPVNAQAGDGILIIKSTGVKGWDSDNDANGVVAGLSAAPNEVEGTEWCWSASC